MLFGLFKLGKWLVPAVLLFGTWQVVVFTRPAPTPLSEPEQFAVRDACEQFVGELMESGARTGATAGVATFGDDPSKNATEICRQVIEETEGLTLSEDSIVQRFLKDVTKAVNDATSLQEILTAGNSVNLDYVVTGRLVSTETLADGGGRAVVQLAAFDSHAGESVVSRQFAGAYTPELATRGKKLLFSLNPITATLIWLGWVGLLPWLTAPLVHKIREMKSNTASFILLLGYVAIDVLLALALSGFAIAGTWGTVRILAALLISAAYSFWACEQIAD